MWLANVPPHLKINEFGQSSYLLENARSGL